MTEGPTLRAKVSRFAVSGFAKVSVACESLDLRCFLPICKHHLVLASTGGTTLSRYGTLDGRNNSAVSLSVSKFVMGVWLSLFFSYWTSV